MFQIWIDIIQQPWVWGALGCSIFCLLCFDSFGNKIYSATREAKKLRAADPRRFHKNQIVAGNTFVSLSNALIMTITSWMIVIQSFTAVASSQPGLVNMMKTIPAADWLQTENIFKFFELLYNGLHAVTFDDYSSQYLLYYKYSLVFALTYSIYDMIYFILHEPGGLNKMLIIVHHSLVFIGQSPVVDIGKNEYIGPGMLLMSAVGFNIEISSIFIHIRKFGQLTRNRFMYFIGGGIGSIVYVVSRVVYFPFILPFAHTTKEFDSFWPEFQYVALTLGYFIFAMSLFYSIIMIATFKKLAFLRKEKEKEKEKVKTT